MRNDLIETKFIHEWLSKTEAENHRLMPETENPTGGLLTDTSSSDSKSGLRHRVNHL